MTVAKSNEDRKYMADAYRKAAFDLLHAARRLQTITTELGQSKVRVAAPCVDDIAEALSILYDLTPARAMARRDNG